MMLHPVMASALAGEHRRDMITRASQAARGAEAGRDARREALLPRYRVSWSRITLSPSGTDGRGRSLVIVISATRGG